MTVTRHPLFVSAAAAQVPPDRQLADRLGGAYAQLPPDAFTRGFVELFRLAPPGPAAQTPDQVRRVAKAVNRTLSDIHAWPDAPHRARRQLRRLGAALRGNGFAQNDVPRLVGTTMAVLVRAAGVGWRMDAIVEWAKAANLLFEAAFAGTFSDRD